MIFLRDVILLVIVVSIDCFAAALTYGLAKIKVGFLSAAVISLVGSMVLWLSLVIADILSRIFSPETAQTVGGLMLVLMGLLMISKRLIRKFVKEKQHGITAIFLDEKKADYDNSKDISVKEAFFLAGILSTDCFLSGLAAGLGFSQNQKIWSIILNFFGGIFAIYLGLFIGKLFSKRIKNVDLSVLDGLVLIMLGVMLTFHI